MVPTKYLPMMLTNTCSVVASLLLQLVLIFFVWIVVWFGCLLACWLAGLPTKPCCAFPCCAFPLRRPPATGTDDPTRAAGSGWGWDSPRYWSQDPPSNLAQGRCKDIMIKDKSLGIYSKIGLILIISQKHFFSSDELNVFVN